MITPQQESAAQVLAAARKDGRPGARLPENIRPADLDSALVIQRRVVALLGQQIGGWKCSVPSEATGAMRFCFEGFRLMRSGDACRLSLRILID